MAEQERDRQTRFRASAWALLGLVVLGAHPLLLGLLFSQDRASLLEDFGALLLAPAAWALGYAIWLGTHVFELTEDALVRSHMGEDRRAEWEDIRAVRMRAHVLFGARTYDVADSVGFLQATRWQVLGRRGWVLMSIPGVMARGRELRLAIERAAGVERAERIEQARARRGKTPRRGDADAVSAGRRRRWSHLGTQGGIAIPLECAVVFVPGFLIGMLVATLA